MQLGLQRFNRSPLKQFIKVHSSNQYGGQSYNKTDIETNETFIEHMRDNVMLHSHGISAFLPKREHTISHIALLPPTACDDSIISSSKGNAGLQK